MQLKAILHGLRWQEVPVSYFKRIGGSKISRNRARHCFGGTRHHRDKTADGIYH